MIMSRLTSTAIFLVVLVVLVQHGTSTHDLANYGDNVVSKKLFNDIGCRGQYNRETMEKVIVFCAACGKLFEDGGEVFGKCRDKCFANEVFGECLNVVQSDERKNNLRQVAANLHSAEAANKVQQSIADELSLKLLTERGHRKITATGQNRWSELRSRLLSCGNK